MKKLVSVLFVLILAFCIFAGIANDDLFSPMTASVGLNFACDQNGLQIKDIEFALADQFSFKDSSKNLQAVVRYVQPVMKGAVRDLSASLTYNANVDAANFRADVLLDANDASGKFKLDTLTASAAVKVIEGNVVIGNSDWDIDNTKYYSQGIPSTRLGFTYAFDGDPARTGLYLGAKIDIAMGDDVKFTPKAHTTLHLIDGKLKLEDTYAGAKISGNIGQMAYEYDMAFKHSYNWGADKNGFYAGLMGLRNKISFADVSACVDMRMEASVHNYDGKVKINIDRLSLGQWENVIQLSVSGNEAGANFTLVGIDYINYPYYKPEDKGLFTRFTANIWNKPFDEYELFRMQLKPNRNEDTMLTLHTYSKEGKLVTDISTFKTGITFDIDFTKQVKE